MAVKKKKNKKKYQSKKKNGGKRKKCGSKKNIKRYSSNKSNVKNEKNSLLDRKLSLENEASNSIDKDVIVDNIISIDDEVLEVVKSDEKLEKKIGKEKEELINKLNIIDRTKNIDSDEFAKDVVIESVINNFGNRACKKYKSFFVGAVIIFLFVFIIIFFPRIRLIGEEDIVLSYKDSYIEPGYNIQIFDRDISDEINIIGNVDSGVVGEYKLEYYVDKFGIRFKKTRNIRIVDMDSPIIDVYSDVINVCPNDDVPDFEYTAIDEYDGDITSKVERIINDDEVILSVKDKSNNIGSRVVKIDRDDSVSPVIKLKGDTTMFISYGSTYSEPGYTVNDNCDNGLSDKVEVSGSVGRDIGTYILTYEVEDASGNKGSVTRKVIVGTKVQDNGEVNTGMIYLTFDDGPNEGTTNKILDILKEEGIKATFFVTCNGPDSLIKRIHDEGHTIALHTATHDYSYIYSSIDNYFSDLNKVGNRVKKITGYESKIIRFPGGSSNTISKNYRKGIMTELSYLVLEQGYRYFDWNVDAMDASTAKSGSDVYYNVTSNLNVNKANVVLMHDTKNITVSALRNIIRFGKENGYSFSEIDMNTYMIRHSVNN